MAGVASEAVHNCKASTFHTVKAHTSGAEMMQMLVLIARLCCTACLLMSARACCSDVEVGMGAAATCCCCCCQDGMCGGGGRRCEVKQLNWLLQAASQSAAFSKSMSYAYALRAAREACS